MDYKHNTNERGALAVISDALPRLNDSAQKTGMYIMNHPRETTNSTITELSKRVGVSEASIVRFAQSIGYSGFHALKIGLAEDIVSPMLLVHEDLGPNDNAGTVMQKAFTAAMRSMEDTIRILETLVVEGAIQALIAASQIGFSR